MTDAMILVVLLPLGLLGLVLWLGSAWLQGYLKGRQEERELEEAEDEEVERIRSRESQRAGELSSGLRSGSLPTTVMRTYSTPDELSWDWARLRDVGYRMDHDPVVLDDSELMVNYSLPGPSRQPESTTLRVVSQDLPSPPK
jgi:hypothetical protein